MYADIQYGNGNLDPRDLAKRVTPRTRAILAVDWGGYPCDYDELLAVAQEHKLALVEDAAHALGATYHGRPVGSVCPYTCFSFQAIKHKLADVFVAIEIARSNAYYGAWALDTDAPELAAAVLRASEDWNGASGAEAPSRGIP